MFRSKYGTIQFIFYRYVMIVLAGACLAAGGAVYNGAFRNILASPSVLGVQSGGGLGNLIYVLLFVSNETQIIRYSQAAALTEHYTLLDRNLQQAMVLAGCFFAVFVVVGSATAAGHGRFKTSHLILSGMIFSSIISSLTGLVQYYLLMTDPADVRIEVIRNLSMGSFDRAYTREHLLLMLAFLAPCIAVFLLLSAKLDALTLGEAEALTLGIPVRLFRNFIIAEVFMMAPALSNHNRIARNLTRISLIEAMPKDRLMRIADAIEDAALIPYGEDPFYSEANMVRLRQSIAHIEQIKISKRLEQ